MRLIVVSFLVGVGLLGCGGASSKGLLESGAPTADAGGAGDGSAGEPDANTGEAAGSAFPCGSAVPVVSALTGYELCEAGYVRRLSVGTCPSAVPRAAAVTNYSPLYDECEFDAECSALPHGHCAPREGGQVRICVPGCVTDQDCDPGRICACDDPVGRCVPATCTSRADCTPGFECASYTTGPGCFATGFACQTPADGCGGEADNICVGLFANPTFCVFQEDRRQCSTLQCTEL